MASTQASKGAGMAMKPPSLKWTEEEIQLIVNWLSFRDTGGKAVNWLLYHKGNKADACRQLLEETKLTEKSGVSKQKTRDKITNMIALYKKWRDKADTTGWGLDISNHNQVGDNTYGKTIQEVLLLKCSFYHEFEKIMGESLIISPLFLMVSGHPNRETEVREEFFHKDTMCDLNTQQNKRLIDEDERVDLPSEKEESWESPSRSRGKSLSPMLFEEDFLSSQPSPGIRYQALTITDNEQSNDDLDLPQIQHLLSHTASAKTNPNKSQQSPKPLLTPQNTHSSQSVPKKSDLSGSLYSRNLPSVSTPSQPNKKRKRRAKSPIDVESYSGNDGSHVKRQKDKLNMGEAVVEKKRIDAKIQKKDQELRAAQADRSEKDAQRRHKLYLLELEDRRIEVRNQAEEQRAEADKRRKEAKERTLQLQLQLAALQSGKWQASI